MVRSGDFLLQQLAQNLREYRRERGISQEALAHELGLSPRYYGSIERAVQNVTVRTVGEIADKIDVHPMALLIGSLSIEQIVEWTTPFTNQRQPCGEQDRPQPHP